MTTPITWKNEQPDLSAKPAVRALDSLSRAALAVFLAFSMFSISVAQSALTVGLLAWLAHAQLTSGWRGLRWPVAWPVILFWLAALVSVALAEDPARAAWGLKKLPQVLIFFWALNLIRSREERDRWVGLLIASATAAALFGLYQAASEGVSLSQRVHGTLSIYMTFSGVLMLAGLVALGRLLLGRRREPWLAGALGLIALALLFTLTRQAWLGFFLGSLVLVFLWRRRLLVAVPLLIAVLILLSPKVVKDRLLSFSNLQDVTVNERVQLWAVGWEIFKGHPVVGCGFHCVAGAHGHYPDPANLLARFGGMHNNLLQIMIDTGALGLSAWLALWVCYLIAVGRRAPPLAGGDKDWARGGAVAAVLAFLAAGMFEVNFYDSEVVMVLYFIMALPFVRMDDRQEAEGSL